MSLPLCPRHPGTRASTRYRSSITDAQLFGLHLATVEYLDFSDFPAVLRLNRSTQSKFARDVKWRRMFDAIVDSNPQHIVPRGCTLHTLTVKNIRGVCSPLWSRCKHLHTLHTNEAKPGHSVLWANRLSTVPIKHVSLWNGQWFSDWPFHGPSFPFVESLRLRGHTMHKFNLPLQLRSLVMVGCWCVVNTLTSFQPVCLHTFSSTGPFDIVSMPIYGPQLRELNVHYFQGVMPDLSACTNLRRLRLVFATDSFSKSSCGLMHCTQLEEIELACTLGTCTLDPSVFAPMKNLKRVYLTGSITLSPVPHTPGIITRVGGSRCTHLLPLL
jgi:hypothetical protein